tara:strand:+ start:12641 stop:13957 length:1317 start_codon:yes stop_codon:yes gene_type:complete
MAKRLDKIGVQTGEIIFAHEVSQSIDAFTGYEAYDINLSGSLNVTGSTKIVGNTSLTGSLNTIGPVIFDNNTTDTFIKNGYLKITSANDAGLQPGIQLKHPSTDPENGLNITFSTNGNGNTAEIQGISDNQLRISTAGRPRLYITASDTGGTIEKTRIGVATSQPETTLHVLGNSTLGDATNSTLVNQTVLNVMSSASNSDMVSLYNNQNPKVKIIQLTELGTGNSLIDMLDYSGSLCNRFRAGDGHSHFSRGVTIGDTSSPGFYNLFVSGSQKISKTLEIDRKAEKEGEQAVIISGSAVLSLPSGSKGRQDFQIMGAHMVEIPYNQEETFYDDDYIDLYYADPELKCTILANPLSGDVNIVYNNEGTYSYFDKLAADGQFDIDTNFGDNETGIITIKSPQDSNYPFYRITVVRADGTVYGVDRMYAIIEKLFKPQPI